MGRRIAFVALLAAMLVQPAARQAFGVNTRWLRDWAMMRGVGLQVIDARFFEVRAGQRTALDRREVLAAHSRMGEYRRMLSTDAEVADAARLLCEALGPDADVRAVTRKNVRSGWVAGLTGEERLCER